MKTHKVLVPMWKFSLTTLTALLTLLPLLLEKPTAVAQTPHPFDVPSAGVLPPLGCGHGTYRCNNVDWCPHNGIDIWTTESGQGIIHDTCGGLTKGNPVFAPYDGTIIALLDRNDHGGGDPEFDGVYSAIVIQHQLDTSFYGVVPELNVYTYYGHMASHTCAESFIDPMVVAGITVHKGDFLGYQGDRSRDVDDIITHLHFAVRKKASPTIADHLDPTPYIGVDCTVCPQTFTRPSSFSSADIALIIDSSGSMRTNDPDNQRLAAANVYLWASWSGDRVAVVDFDDTARLTSGLLVAREGNEANQTLREAIGAIDSYGDTNIRDGIAVACQELTDHGQPPMRGAILLTDGQHNVGAFGTPQECFSAQDWPIFAFGFGDANETLLQTIASDTGGSTSPFRV